MMMMAFDEEVYTEYLSNFLFQMLFSDSERIIFLSPLDLNKTLLFLPPSCSAEVSAHGRGEDIGHKL